VFDPLLRLLTGSLPWRLCAQSSPASWPTGLNTDPIEKTLWNLHILTGYVTDGGLADAPSCGACGAGQRTLARSVASAVGKTASGNLRLDAHRVGTTHRQPAYLFAYGVMALMVVTGLGLSATEFQTGPLAGCWAHPWLEDVLGEPNRSARL